MALVTSLCDPHVPLVSTQTLEFGNKRHSLAFAHVAVTTHKHQHRLVDIARHVTRVAAHIQVSVVHRQESPQVCPVTPYELLHVDFMWLVRRERQTQLKMAATFPRLCEQGASITQRAIMQEIQTREVSIQLTGSTIHVQSYASNTRPFSILCVG